MRVSLSAGRLNKIKIQTLLFGCLCSLIVSSCAINSASNVSSGIPLEYFQTFKFSSNFQQVKAAIHDTLKKKEFEIQKEDAIQITALNTELTSVELITFAAERLKPTQSVFSGEITLIVDYLEAPGGGNLRERSTQDPSLGRAFRTFEKSGLGG